ncbi:MAG: AAA family ATPase, partial [Chloroflexota bacterium]
LQATESPKTFRNSAKSEKANDEGAKIYEDLLKQAAKRLEQGRSIILNATFHTSTYRVAARTLARDHGAEFMLVECDAEDEIILERARQQPRKSGRSKQSRAKLLRDQRKAFRPSREIYRKDKVPVDTASSLEEQIPIVLAEL